MKWWLESKTRIFFDMHMPDWPDRQTCTAFNPEALADTFARSGADSVILYAKCQYGNAYYPSAIGPMHSGLNGLDLMGRLRALLRDRGLRVILYYAVAWDEAYAEAHPEALVQGPKGETQSEEFRWRTICLNSAYRAHAQAQLQEIATQLQPDGFWIDMTIIGKDRCYCPRCRDAFRSAYGYALPDMPEGSAKQDFIAFRYGVVEGFYRETIALLRATLPEVCLVANYWGYPYSSWSMGTRILEATEGFDYVTGEGYTDWTGLMAPGLFARYLRSVGNGRPAEVLLSRFLITWDFTRKAKAQLLSEMYTVAALGGCPTIDDQPFADGRIEEAVYADVAQGFHEINRRRATLRGTPLRYAAVLVSQESKDAYPDGDETYTRAFSGAYSLLQRMGVPTDFCFDHRLKAEELAQYAVVLAPGVSVCERAQWDALRQYMARGGIVVAGGAFAHWRQGANGAEPADFLSDVGVTGAQRSEASLSYLKVEDELLLMRGQYMRYPPLAGAAGTVVEPICAPGGGRFFHNNLPAPYAETAHPGMLVLPVGKGKLILCAHDIFAEYAGYASARVYALVSGLLARHAPPPCVRLRGHGNRIELSALRTEDALYIHLVNFTPARTVCLGRMDTFHGQYERTIEHMEEAVPVADVALTLAGLRVTSAQTLGGEGTVSFENSASGAVLCLSRLAQWETLCVRTQALR